MRPVESAELKEKVGKGAPDLALRCAIDVVGGGARLECIDIGRRVTPGLARGILREDSSPCGILGKEKSKFCFISMRGAPPVAMARLPMLSMLLDDR